MNYFNKNLNYIIKTRSIKKIELAEKLGITRQAINQYINNQKSPTYENLIKISNELNISIDDLLKKDLESQD